MRKMRAVQLNMLATLFIMVFGLNSTALAITNGEPDGDRHPYVGLVVFDTINSSGLPDPTWRCTGSLIMPWAVLTAGHCTDGAVGARVWFNERVLRPHYPYPGPDAVEAAYIFTHPDFEIGYGPGLIRFITHDVGLVILEEPVEMDEYAALPTVGLVDTLPMNTAVDLVGYGVQTAQRGGGQPYWIGLRNRFYAPAQLIMSDQVISDEFLMVTANPAQGKGGTCFGDSGGPILLGGDTIVLGVNSFVTSSQCAGISYSTRIDTADILNWIYEFLDGE